MITWTVYNLVRRESDNVVEQVCCRVSLASGDIVVGGDVSQKVPYKDPSDPSFIPFNQLTEAETVQWVKNQMGPTRVAQVERGLQQMLDKQKAKLVNGVPW